MTWELGGGRVGAGEAGPSKQLAEAQHMHCIWGSGGWADFRACEGPSRGHGVDVTLLAPLSRDSGWERQPTRRQHDLKCLARCRLGEPVCLLGKHVGGTRAHSPTLTSFASSATS